MAVHPSPPSWTPPGLLASAPFHCAMAACHLCHPCVTRRPGRCRLGVVAHLDYTATASDEGVLKLPARTELDPAEVKYTFGYPR